MSTQKVSKVAPSNANYNNFKTTETEAVDFQTERKLMQSNNSASKHTSFVKSGGVISKKYEEMDEEEWNIPTYNYQKKK